MLNDYLLNPYIKDNIISLKNLKESNLPLYLYVQGNLDYVTKGTGVEILDEFKPIRGVEALRKYLKYYYGDEINITKVRADNASIYNNICAIGNPEDVVSDLGFYVEYDRKITMDELKKELDALLVNGLVGKLTKKLDNKLRYEANKKNMTVMQYLGELGYTSSYGGSRYIALQKEWNDLNNEVIED